MSIRAGEILFPQDQAVATTGDIIIRGENAHIQFEGTLITDGSIIILCHTLNLLGQMITTGEMQKIYLVVSGQYYQSEASSLNMIKNGQRITLLTNAHSIDPAILKKIKKLQSFYWPSTLSNSFKESDGQSSCNDYLLLDVDGTCPDLCCIM